MTANGDSGALRLLVGLGASDRARALLEALRVSGDLRVARHCLSVDEVLAAAAAREGDAIVLSERLHRLTRTTLADLARTGLPIAVVVAHPSPDHWASAAATLLPLDATVPDIRKALSLGVRDRGSGAGGGQQDASVGAREQPSAPTVAAALHLPDPRPPTPDPRPPSSIIAVAGGPGAPGRTTVATNLAIALGSLASTLLLEADVLGPSIAARLDMDPTRNLAVFAHADPQTPQDWDQGFGRETQALHPRSPHARLLLGIPTPDRRRAVTPRFVEQVLEHARQRYRFVVVDTGPDLAGADAAIHRAVLGQAGVVLLVAATDLPGIASAHQALRLLRSQIGIPADRLALVLNRHDPRLHQRVRDIAFALGVAAAAVVPEDHRACARAAEAQQAVVLDPHSRAGTALLRLANRVYGGALTLPPEPAPSRRWFAFRWPWSPFRSLRWRRSRPEPAPAAARATPSETEVEALHGA